MNFDVVAFLESLSGWSKWEEMTTSVGPRLVKRIGMAPKIWDLWNNSISKNAMRANGYVVYKSTKTNITELVRIQEIMSESQRKAMLEESRMLDHEQNMIIAKNQKYMGFQKAGIKFAIDRLFGHHGQQERDAMLFGDDMGVGKTLQAIGVMCQDPNLHSIRGLVICPASVKINWRNEMRKFMPDGIGYEAEVVKKAWPGGLLPPRFVIVNYDVVHKYHKELIQTTWDYLILDECHYLKNETTRWTAYTLGGIRKEDGIELYTAGIPAAKTMFLSGTPIPNRVIEAWPIVKRCDPNGLGANKDAFNTRYCKTKDHAAELQERMRKFMIRRMKTDVFNDFPPKMRSVYLIDPDECKGIEIGLFQQEMQIFKEYQESLHSWQARTEISKAYGDSAHAELKKEKKQSLGLKMSELSKMRKRTALAKAPAVADRVCELSQGGKTKILVFAHHREVMDLIQKKCEAKGLRVAQINGDTPKDDRPTGRQGIVDRFQREELDVLVLGYKPGGVGLTLTKATTVIMAELDYVPGNMTQAEDRAWRNGQKNSVYVEHETVEGSLDEFMANILITKQEIISKVLDWNEEGDMEESEEDWMVKDRAATQSFSAAVFKADSLRIDLKMAKVIDLAIKKLVETKAMKNIDLEIVEGLKEAPQATGTAMKRRIALRYKTEIPELEPLLKWPAAA